MLLVSCGGSPNAPGNVTPPPTTPPPNVPPGIDSIRVQGRGSKEPANFSDLGETVDVIATVHDPETPVEELQYSWTADVGAFDGTGAKVEWRAPDAATTPAAATLSLKVTEKYGYPGAAKIYQQDVTSSAVVSLHNSRQEVGDMARQFLLDFSDSNIRDISSIMRNFIPGCYGTKEETDEVAENRRRYRILDWRVGEPQTTINFGGVCPYRAKRGDSCSAVPVFWNSADMDNHGAVGAVSGTDWIAAFYMPDKQRWGLCDSSFEYKQGVRLQGFIR
jgi:hypothetical protein